MKPFLFFSSFIFGLGLSFPLCLAQETSKVPSTPKNVKVGRTVYDFEEADILGNIRKPPGSDVVKAPDFYFRRLLDLDESFVPEIIRSADEF